MFHKSFLNKCQASLQFNVLKKCLECVKTQLFLPEKVVISPGSLSGLFIFIFIYLFPVHKNLLIKEFRADIQSVLQKSGFITQ